MPISQSDAIVLVMLLASVLAFMGLSWLAAKRQQNTLSDYLAASRQTPPLLVGLSTMAALCSGFMFIGLTGFIYEFGVLGVSYLGGTLVGEVLIWTYAFPRLRQRLSQKQFSTFAHFIAGSDRAQARLQSGIAVLTILCFLPYAAAQFIAINKAFEVFLHYSGGFGLVLFGVVITLSAAVGGMRSSIWVSSMQALMMLSAMWLVAIAALQAAGGVANLWSSNQLLETIGLWQTLQHQWLTFLAFFLGWLGYGFANCSMPHIINRTMTIKSAAALGRSRNLYVLAHLALTIPATVIGLSARVLVPDLAASQAELVFPLLTQRLLPALGVGLVLSGLFAAAASSAEAMLLTCTEVVTQDLWPKAAQPYRITRISTIGIALLMLITAWVLPQNVFALVTLSIIMLGTTLAPMIVMRSLGRSLHLLTAVTMLLATAVTIYIWQSVLHWSEFMGPGLAATLASAIAYLVIQHGVLPRLQSKVVSDSAG
ncbi:MAG: hypothetical protein AAGF24_01520 [Cyanobacteria bacterium P01_H01_bin.121]